MIVTENDALFCVLHSCRDKLESSRLIYYTYLYQLSKLNFEFKFRLNASGLVCKGLDLFLDEVINQDKLNITGNGIISLTSQGYLYYDNIILSAEEWDFYNDIKVNLDRLSESELFFICVTNMIVYDVLKKYGTSGLQTRKSSIVESISRLSPEYSDDNFNTALKFIRMIKEGKCYE